MNRKIERLVLTGVLVVVSVWLLTRSESGALFDRFDRLSHDLAMKQLVETSTVSDEVTVVVVDDESLARLEERWPLDRGRWGDAINRIASYGPATIAIDAWFESPAPRDDVDLALDVADQIRDGSLGDLAEGQALARALDRAAALRDGDRRFAFALAEYGRAILGIACTPTASDIRRRESSSRPAALAVDHVPGRALPCPQIAGNTPSLAQSARRQAGLNLLADDVGVVRRYHYFFRQDTAVFPSLGMAALIVARPDEADALIARAAAADRGAPVLRHSLPGAIRTVRFSDVIESPLGTPALEQAFRGRIVLVGVSALGTEDTVATALTRRMPGVFVHAAAIGNLLTDQYLETEGTWPDRAVLGAVALTVMTGVASWWVPSVALLIGFVVLVGTAWTGLWAWGVGQGVFIPLLPVLAACLVWAGVRLVFIGLRVRADRQREDAIRRAFQHYLAPQVVQALVDDPNRLRLGGDRRELTAFFADIQGFTAISEQLDPLELVQLLNQCLGTMSEIIIAEGGTIDKYVGDAVVAMFGAPIGDDRHALRACRAALRCQAALDALQDTWVSRGLPRMRARIGLNSGTALVGNMGSELRFDYTMIGDTVNLAARLEGANATYGTRILAGEETVLLAGDDVVTREIDVVRPKGKQRAVQIAEVMALPADADEALQGRIAAYEAALADYRAQRWPEALDRLAPLVEMDDGPAMLLAERIRTFRLYPPPEDWDGVYTMTTK